MIYSQLLRLFALKCECVLIMQKMGVRDNAEAETFIIVNLAEQAVKRGKLSRESYEEIEEKVKDFCDSH